MNGLPQIHMVSTWRHWLLVLVSASAWLAATCPSRTAVSDFVVSVDFDPLTGGIQNSLTVEAGQAFNAYLVLQYNDTVGLDSYRFSVQHNPAAMTAITASHFAPTTYAEGLAGPPVLLSGLVTPFTADSSDPFNGPLNIGPIVVGEINFAAGANGGNFLISPFEDPLFDGAFNNNGDMLLTRTFQSGFLTITAVPEPTGLSALFVLLSATLLRLRHSFIGLYRQRRGSGV